LTVLRLRPRGRLGLELPTLHSLFSSLVAHGGADLDHSALIVELRRLNGVADAAA